MTTYVYTVFGVAPTHADFDLAPEPSPGRNPKNTLHWKGQQIADEEAWPPTELTHGVGHMHIEMHGDDPREYHLEVSALNLALAEQRWRHVAQTLVPGTLWRELEPLS